MMWFMIFKFFNRILDDEMVMKFNGYFLRSSPFMFTASGCKGQNGLISKKSKSWKWFPVFFSSSQYLKKNSKSWQWFFAFCLFHLNIRRKPNEKTTKTWFTRTFQDIILLYIDGCFGRDITYMLHMQMRCNKIFKQ